MSGGTTVFAEPRDHVVQFYEDDAQLVETVGPYIAGALRTGECALVVATPDHRRAFEAWLTAAGIDVGDARTRGTLVTLDAAQTLARLTVDGQPDPAGFDAVVGALVRKLASGGRPLRAYGEMVALLWDEGRVPAAIALETLWNDLGRDTAFSLFCSYREAPTGEHAHDLDHVCDLHSAVVGGDATSHFGHEPQAARAARRFVTDTLRRWRYGDDLVDDAAMVVTELVTNSLVHARSATTVAISARRDTVRIAVRDALARPPVERHHNGAAAWGRGISLVAAMAERWGTEPAADGKVVWAELGTGVLR